MPKSKNLLNSRLQAYATILIDNKKRFEKKEKNVKEFLSREEIHSMAVDKHKISPIEKSTLGEDFVTFENLYKLNLVKKKEGKTLIYAVIDPDIPFAYTTITPKKKSEIKKSLSILETIDNPFLRDQVERLKLQFQDEFEENEKGNHPFIQFDKSPLADGSGWIQTFYKEIREKSAAKIEYEDFNKNTHHVEFLPFQLREFNQRWYIIGYSPTLAKKHGEKMFNLALDRIVNVSPNLEYKRNDFENKRSLFEEHNQKLKFTIGFTVRDEERNPIQLKIKVSNNFRGYIASKKIIDNQREVQPGIFVMTVIKNKELVAKLLSFQQEIEILEPLEYREEFKKILNEMLSLYS